MFLFFVFTYSIYGMSPPHISAPLLGCFLVGTSVRQASLLNFWRFIIVSCSILIPPTPFHIHPINIQIPCQNTQSPSFSPFTHRQSPCTLPIISPHSTYYLPTLNQHSPRTRPIIPLHSTNNYRYSTTLSAQPPSPASPSSPTLFLWHNLFISISCADFYE